MAAGDQHHILMEPALLVGRALFGRNKWPFLVSEHTKKSATYFSCGEPREELKSRGGKVISQGTSGLGLAMPPPRIRHRRYVFRFMSLRVWDS